MNSSDRAFYIAFDLDPVFEPPEPRELWPCDCCGEMICEGDRYCNVGGWRFCEDCIDNGMKDAEPDDFEDFE